MYVEILKSEFCPKELRGWDISFSACHFQEKCAGMGPTRPTLWSLLPESAASPIV